MTHGDQILLCLTPAGEALAANLRTTLAKHGQTTVEHVVEVVPGIRMLELTVQGKRTNEGMIAADVKRRKV